MRKVEAPIIAPNRCIFCPQGHRGGQVIDSEIDYPFGRLYVCLLHAELIAVAAGYAEGEECERLKSADVLLAEAEKGTALERELRQALATTVNELEERVQELAGERDHALIRANQAEAKLAELGQDIGATLAAVGAPRPDFLIAAAAKDPAILAQVDAKLAEMDDADVDCNAFPPGDPED